MLDLGQYQIKGSTAREIASSAEAAIREGLLETGDALPTVRALAERLKASPATVNAAYRILRERGLVIAEGRRGTRVALRPPLRLPPPAGPARPVDPAAPGVRDLTIGLPDPDLLPPIEPALGRVDLERSLRMGLLEAPNRDLLEVGAEAFAQDGIPAGALAVVAGAFDGLERVLQAHLRPGDRVLVEDPAYIGVVDLLLALGLVAVPVAVDESGLVPEEFAGALRHGVEAAVIVPRAQNPFGSAMDEEREAMLRDILAKHQDLLVIEDDHAGSVSGARFSTLVTPQLSRWAVLRSVSKDLHPDLRLALMAGDETTIARVEGRQALGPRWVSHIIQALVAEMLRAQDYPLVAAHARDVYTARRRALIDALAEQGLEAHGRSGLNVWVPLREEAPVVRGLDAAGWRVVAGERFRLMSPPGIRVTISTLREDEAPELAEAIAGVALAARPRRLY
ncbi:MAG: aminotransferase class I/II-fold pyridoxal phosphate-dependent enzyme [Solirubrobacteraceae bacterium]